MAEVDMYQPIMSERPEGDERPGEGSEEVQSEYRSDPSISIEYDEEFENLVNTLMHDKDYISVNQAALNITYTIINAGLIAIPFTAYNAGIPLFIAVIVIMSLISYYVAVMVINMAHQKRVRTLEDLAEVCGGPRFFFCVCAAQILFSFSMMCVTLDVWADVMSDVFSASSLTGLARHLLATRRGEVLLGATIVLPLCVFKRSMISLRWTAYLTVCAVAFCMCAVVVSFFAHKEGPSLGTFLNLTFPCVRRAVCADCASYFVCYSPDTSATDLVTPQSEWWTVMFVVVFCFSYNQRVFAVYRCLKRRSPERWTQAVRKASLSVTVLYLLFGIAGYLTLARNGIKLDNFNYFLDDHGENSVLFNVAR
jgi:amino acid permease